MSKQRQAASGDDQRHLGDILQRLATIAPDDVKAITVLAADALERREQERLQALLQGILRNH